MTIAPEKEELSALGPTMLVDNAVVPLIDGVPEPPPATTYSNPCVHVADPTR
jgi:hypothetical protein